jgi:hypothetical protein
MSGKLIDKNISLPDLKSSFLFLTKGVIFMSQTTGNPRGSNTSTSGNSQRTDTTNVTSGQTKSLAGQGSGVRSDVTAKFQPSTKSTQNQHQQGKWEKNAGNTGSSNTQIPNRDKKDEGKSSYYTGGKK